jgi:hypothetical protein
MTQMGAGQMNSIQRLLVLLSFLAAGFALLFRPHTAQAQGGGEPATATPGNKEEMTDEEIPLREAATRTYEDTGGAIARGLDKSSEEILSYYCYALADKIPIYGRFPPSHKKGKVDLTSSHTRRIVFEGNITHAKSLYAGEEGASNLYVLKSDLARAIEGIKQQL